MKKIIHCLSVTLAITSLSYLTAGASDSLKVTTPAGIVADADNAGLKLPNGFSALKVAENVGKSRHIVVTAQGDLYVKLDRLVNGKGVLRLHDSKGNGKADNITGLGNYGGTGITIKNGYLYASSNTEVFRYKLNAKNEVINPDAPEKIITGLGTGQHPSKSIVLDNENHIYVNQGAYSNSCQEQDRTLGSKGKMPCPVLNDAAGIWQYSADKLNQTQADGIRYGTGLRNVVGLDWNQQTNSLFVMQHGRDQLFQNWPEFFTEKQSAELPSECMYEIKKGANAGWPYIFYDHIQHKKILAPEYGGDGKKEGGKDAIDPVVAFPGQAVCSPRNIRMVLLSHFMVHGTGHRCHRKGIMWYLYLLRMANHQVIRKYLRTVFRDLRKSTARAKRSTVPVVWRRARMAHCMCLMMQKELSIA